MAEADRIAAALAYQEQMPAMLNPNLARQGARGRANMMPPTSIMDERYPAFKRNQEDVEKLMLGVDLVGSAIPLAGPAMKGAKVLGQHAAPQLAQALENYAFKTGMALPMVERQAGRTFAAPQDKALRLAQERAALPVEQGGLGLPPNNTSEQRAAAMGFDTPAYHGTVGDKKSFEKNKSIQKDSGWYGNEAVYTTADPNSANAYANWANLKNNTNEMYQQNVMPLIVRKGKVFEYGDAPPMATREEADKFTKIVRDNLGYDTVVVSNKYAAPEYAQNYEIASFNPDNIRSRFAAFDPFRRNAAIAAAMGVAAPDLLAKERNK